MYYVVWEVQHHWYTSGEWQDTHGDAHTRRTKAVIQIHLVIIYISLVSDKAFQIIQVCRGLPGDVSEILILLPEIMRRCEFFVISGIVFCRLMTSRGWKGPTPPLSCITVKLWLGGDGHVRLMIRSEPSLPARGCLRDKALTKMVG